MAEQQPIVASEYHVVPLDASTFDAFCALVRKHNGVFGGCWCTWFHPQEDRSAGPDGESVKRRLVAEGRAHAALVMNQDRAVGWCEFGSPAELPRIYHRKEYEETAAMVAPYRITCFFVDRDHRRRGVASMALRGAVDLIARAGGGRVESYPVRPDPDKKISSSFLFSGTRHMFEAEGFQFDRQLGTKRAVMWREVAPDRR